MNIFVGFVKPIDLAKLAFQEALSVHAKFAYFLFTNYCLKVSGAGKSFKVLLGIGLKLIFEFAKSNLSFLFTNSISEVSHWFDEYSVVLPIIRVCVCTMSESSTYLQFIF